MRYETLKAKIPAIAKSYGCSVRGDNRERLVRTRGIVVALLLLLPVQAWGATVQVPVQFSTIQSAIAAASTTDGDLILVAPGTYGAIDFLGKAVTVRSSEGPEVTVIDAGNSGSAVQMHSGEGSSATLDGFTITGGQAGIGGGVLVQESSPTIRNCWFLDNHAEYGAGMYVYRGAPTVTSSIFRSNSAQYNGGGLMSSYAFTLVSNCLFEDNTASYGGGGMYNQSEAPAISDCRFEHNTPDGMENYVSSPSIVRSIFRENLGVGMRNTGNSEAVSRPVIQDCVFELNSPAGGMDNNGGYPIVERCRFFGNTGYSGGGMRMLGRRFRTDVIDCEFVENVATTGGGGMASIDAMGLVKGCSFIGNVAQGVTDDANEAQYAGGGGMLIYDDELSSQTDVVDSIFTGNVAEGRAGFRVDNGPYHYGLDGGGGAIQIGDVGPTRIINSIIRDNTARFGGGIYLYRATGQRIINSTITANTADEAGGLFVFSNPAWAGTPFATVELHNSIVWDNPAESGTQDLDFPFDGAAVFRVQHSDVRGGAAGSPDDANLDVDPQFVDAASGDMRLLPGSPCIDAGDDDLVPPDVATDLAGAPRIQDSSVDMGAYELRGASLCSQPVSAGANPIASDCLYLLRAALGLETCVPACICDPTGDDVTTAADALACLKKAIGQHVPLSCAC